MDTQSAMWDHVEADPGLDVHYVNGAIPKESRTSLIDELGRIEVVRPAPFYENRIDPNIGAFDAGGGAVWVPVGFEIRNVRTVEIISIVEAAAMRQTGKKLPTDVNRRLFSFCDVTDGRWPVGHSTIRSRIPDVDPHAHSRVYSLVEEVLDAALPLLAALRLPSLLLPGPLQVVVKAQSIVLKEGERYEGVWHEDGLREDVVAVVLYYYNVSSSLSGGAIELAQKQPMTLGFLDHDAEYTLYAQGARKALQNRSRCIVPSESGSLVVFSNYASVHRILPIEALAEGGSRDFLALFVIDQKAPLATPRDLGPQEMRRARRAELLGEQLQTRGVFGVDDSEVYTTRNGSYADIAWVSQVSPLDLHCLSDEDNDNVCSIVSQVNMAPPVVGRGSSYLAQLQVSCDYNPESPWVQYVIGPPETALILFVNTRTFKYQESVPKSDGVHEARAVDSCQEFVNQGFWTDDESLSTRLKATLAQQT